MIQFDFSKCGVADSKLSKIRAKMERAVWQGLPEDTVGLRHIQDTAQKIAERFETLLVLGIGGSSQGLKAVVQTLPPSKTGRKLFILESPDPRSVSQVLEQIDLTKTCLNVISKSGETLETLTLFDFFRPKLKKDQIVVTTEKGEGKLYRFVKEENVSFFEIPKEVPGRFSVFSAVGLFPLAFVSVGIEKFLEGARQADLKRAFKNGALHYYLGKEEGKTISVMMPYADCLYEFGLWYSQLWAESLGKEGQGQTPLVAVGPQAQHSLAQLFLDGPKDKIVTLIAVVPKEKEPFSELLIKECKATATALFESGCPSIQITLPDLSLETMGELMMTYQFQTAFAGHLMGVNPYDQSAVELIKKRLR